jgi:hypothetical protein
MPPASRRPTTIETVLSMLESLGTELDRAGWTTRLQAAPGRAPALFVQNPEPGAALAETIYAAPKDDGFWFWWSWAEPIAQDAGSAAAIIRRALRATTGAQL